MRRRMSGNPEAPLVLDYVYRRHLFTDRRRIGDQPVYRSTRCSASSCSSRASGACRRKSAQAALDRAAGQLVARGDFEAAAALYIEAKAWPALVGLTLHAGRSLLAEGRRKALVRWLAAMPAEIRDAEPRLALGEAYAVMYDEPARCKALLERAYEAFVARNDVRRQLLTAAAAVDCHYFEWADFTPLDRWIDVLTRLLRRGNALSVHRGCAAHSRRAAHRAAVPPARQSRGSTTPRARWNRCSTRPTSSTCP